MDSLHVKLCLVLESCKHLFQLLCDTQRAVSIRGRLRNMRILPLPRRGFLYAIELLAAS